jgi:hypothetical protein
VTGIPDDEFEELPECEPAWLLRSRATAYRRGLLASGSSPLPVSGKAPPITGWQEIQATEDVIAVWEDKYANATNTGILTRTTPAIDIDVLDPAVADEIQQIAERIIGLSPVRIGQAPKRALLYRTDLPFDKLVTPIRISPDGRAHKVEVLCDGQQIVVKGIHPGTHADYTWAGAEPGPALWRDALPELDLERATEFIAAAEQCMSAHGWTPKKKINGAAGATCNGQRIASERERAYAQAALDGCADELAQAMPGARNDTSTRRRSASARWWIAAGFQARRCLMR